MAVKIDRNGDTFSLANKFKHGFKYHWVTVHGVQVSLAAATLLSIATGLILAMKDGKIRSIMVVSGKSSSKDDFTIPGLQNLGNNCFLNVVLQALASCKSFSKFLEHVVEECEGSSMEGSRDLPVVAALAWLIDELSTARHERAVLSPRRLMHAMTSHVPNFNLTSQQDAEEALSHLLSSLRAELSESYVRDPSSLADVITLPNCRIVTQRMKGKSEQERWRQSFLGPFDGILGSVLTCQSCSLQSSLDFQLFHSLHLVPLSSSSGLIMPGCSVEHCLKQFFVAEQLENYKCSQCWHTAAIAYVSSMDENEAIVEKLKLCNDEDLCDCKQLECLASFRWLNSFSRTFKQLSIGRSPKILCLHLQRASINVLGEPDKLQGEASHITHSKSHKYRLASVVQHFGIVGSGHYIVYRRATAKISEDNAAELLESAVDQWFCISDIDVHTVSEKEVLDAEASLLFYEKVSDC